MHQVLMAIDAGCMLRFHLLVRGFGRRAGRLCILVASPAGGAVPPLQLHARPVGRFRPSLVEFLDSGGRGSPCSLDRRRARPSARIFSAPHTGRSLNGSSRRTRSWRWRPRRRIPRRSILPQELRREAGHRPISPLPLLFLAYLGRFGSLLELLMKLRGRWTIKRAR